MNKKNIYFLFTIYFLLASFFVFAWFIIYNKSLIWKGDGWNQQFRALVYYSEFLKDIFRTLLYEHTIAIPEWNFYIGEGNDILNSLHYYAIGDPIALLSIFIPSSYMHYYFSFAQILRLYLAGIAFVLLCVETEIENTRGIIAGAISYCFCSWGLTFACDHPSFVNPMIYFPLMILGIEKIIRKNRSFLFTMVVALSVACNFYFFYMLALLTAGYAIVRIVYKYNRDIKCLFSTIIRIGIAALAGLGVSAVIALPVFVMLINDPRVANEMPFRLLYPLYYYMELPAIIMSNYSDYALHLGLSVSVVIALIDLLLFNRRFILLNSLVLICFLIMLFPVGGRILNGMSYTTNRWSWAFALLCCYILAFLWKDIISLEYSKWKKTVVCSGILCLPLLFFERSRGNETVSAVLLLVLALGVLRFGKEHFKDVTLFIVTFISVISVSFWLYSPFGYNYASKCVSNDEVWVRWNDIVAESIKTLSDSDYPRYTGREITDNVNLNSKISNTQYYWSMSNPYVNEFRSDLSMREQKMYSYHGYDDRTTPIELSAVRYYAVEKECDAGMPYGYLLIGTSGKYEIYENQNTLPLGYCYNSVIDNLQWENMDPVQRQEIEMHTALVEGKDIESMSDFNEDITDYSIPYDIAFQSEGIAWTDTGFAVTDKDCVLVLNLLEQTDNSEIYIGFEGIKFLPVPEYDLYFGDEKVDPISRYNPDDWEKMSKDEKTRIIEEKLFWNPVLDPDFIIDVPGVRKIIHYQQPDAAYSSGRHDYIANMGYSNEGVSQLKITVPLRGVYSFDDLKVYKVPMDGFSLKADDLRVNSLNNISIGNNEICGDISVEDHKVLCVAIPYSKGWRCYIGDKEAELLRINKRYIGMLVPPGDHSVRFIYERPLQGVGMCISAVTLLVILTCVLKKWVVRNR